MSLRRLIPLLLGIGQLTANERPNILFLFSDDHAPNAISCYPGGLFDKISPTPGIDRWIGGDRPAAPSGSGPTTTRPSTRSSGRATA